MQERERNNCLRANNKFSVSEDLQTSNDKAANYFHEVVMTTHGAIATRVRYYCSPLGFGVWVADFFLQLRAQPNKIPSRCSRKRKRGFTSWFSMKSAATIVRDVESESGPAIYAFFATFPVDLVAEADPRTLVTPRRTQFSISDVGALDIKKSDMIFFFFAILSKSEVPFEKCSV